MQIPAGTWVEIQNVGYFQNGATLQMPMGVTIKYRAWDAAKKYATDWTPKKIDCTALAPPYCAVKVVLSGRYAWVEIQNVGWFQNGATIQMLMGASFKYRAYDANKQNCTGWITKNVDCSDLIYPEQPT